jgi:hypothetical protein
MDAPTVKVRKNDPKMISITRQLSSGIVEPDTAALGADLDGVATIKISNVTRRPSLNPNSPSRFENSYSLSYFDVTQRTKTSSNKPFIFFNF